MRGRTFSLEATIAQIRAEPDRTRRRALLTVLGNQARADQAALRNHVLGLGGAVAEQFWALSACVVEIQPGLLPALRAHRDVVALFPDDERDPAEARSIPWIEHSPVLTGTNGTDAMNHNVPAAQALLGHKGLGARLAVLDTGIDSDQSGTNTGAACGVDPDPHRAFRDAQGVSRVEAHLQVGSIGCNSTNPPVDPWCPGTVYLEARHGTGVAAIAAGAADSPTSYFCAGHAEEASIISVVISNTPQFNTSPWATSASTVIAGIEAVQYHMLAEDVPVHVANYSYDGWPDPDHPTQHAFDLLERNFDVLVVTAAANEGDAATISSGFTNGLHVGNVHRFAAATARYPHRLTSRGPLFGDADRYYPDVCASGASAGTTLDGTVAQIVMPLIDDLYTAQSGCAGCMRAGFGQFEYNAQGTSMAAPQVSGAALLYRAERPSATAQETRAALLLTSVDPFVEQSPVVDLHHTYVGRNSHGVGYVRDDLLARYALRLDQALGQSTTLTPSVPDVVVGYSGLLSGDLHAVAIAWPRIFTEGDTEVPWANVDLEIRTTAGALLARSDSLRNPYERLVFKAAGVSTVQVHVLGVDLHGKDVPVFVAARRLGGDGTIESKRSVPGYVAVLPQEAGCTMSVQEQSVSRTLPSTYEQAYGSFPLITTTPPAGLSSDPFGGMLLAQQSSNHRILNVYGSTVLGIDPSVTPGTVAYRVRALCLRQWAPLTGCDGTLTVDAIRMDRLPPGPPANQMSDPRTYSGGTLVAQNVSVPIFKPDWHARRWDTWPVVVPLNMVPSFDVKAGENLLVWFDFGAAPPLCPISVDAVADLPSDPYASYHSGDLGAVPGQALVLGVVEGEVVPATPQLAVYGWPALASDVLFTVRQAGNSTTAVLYLGLSNPDFLATPCRILTSGDLAYLGPLVSAPMGHLAFSYNFPNDPAIRHQHVFAQAVVQYSGGAIRYTNGLRMTIGGTYP